MSLATLTPLENFAEDPTHKSCPKEGKVGAIVINIVQQVKINSSLYKVLYQKRVWK